MTTAPSAPVGQGFHHISLVTSDMDAIVRFYNGILGFPIVSVRRAMGMRWYMFGLGAGSAVGFFETGPQIESAERQPGAALPVIPHFDHLAFSVPTLDDLDRLRARLTDAGCEVSDTYTYPVFKSLFFADPDGLQLEAACWTSDLTPLVVPEDLSQSKTRIDDEPVDAVDEFLRTGAYTWLPKTKLAGDVLLTSFADDDFDASASDPGND